MSESIDRCKSHPNSKLKIRKTNVTCLSKGGIEPTQGSKPKKGEPRETENEKTSPKKSFSLY